MAGPFRFPTLKQLFLLRYGLVLACEPGRQAAWGQAPALTLNSHRLSEPRFLLLQRV